MTIKRGEVTEALQKETEAHLVDKTHTDYDSKYVDLLQAQKDSKTRIDGEQVIIDNPATGSLKKKDTIREQAREQIKLNEAKAQIASTEEKKLAQVGHLEHI